MFFGGLDWVTRGWEGEELVSCCRRSLARLSLVFLECRLEMLSPLASALLGKMLPAGAAPHLHPKSLRRRGENPLSP